MAEQEEQIFNLTNRVREAVMLINDIQESKLAIMVRRLARKVGVKGDAFTKEELTQLQEHLSVSANEIDTIVEACSFFLERSAYHVIKADLLSAHLQEAGLIPSHANVFAEIWSSEGKEILRRLRLSHNSGMKELMDIDWRIHLKTGTTGMTRELEPRAIFSFKFKEENDGESGARPRDNVRLEFQEDQLVDFLHKLDVVQSQLDLLS
mmetsp:Transcript_47445/g.148413  ORF Transcript_47445/g.148413 Transcript_47445/m.148413 type:complete len:208 (-) Transcript_47445:68-691(-)